MLSRPHPLSSVLGALFFAVVLVISASYLGAQETPQNESVDALQALIDERNKQLESIEAEIRKYEAQLNEVGKDKQSLQNAIDTLDISRKKILTDIRATETKISSTDLEIQELDREITIKQLEIGRNEEAVAATFQKLDELDDRTLLEIVLNNQTLGEAWDSMEEQTQFQVSLRADIQSLLALKTEYERAKLRSLGKKQQLAVLQDELVGEKSALDQTRDQQEELLEVTENKEENYQALLAEKKAAKEQFEREIREYESKLSFILDRSTIPAVGSGVLAWPFEQSYMAGCPAYNTALGNAQCLTQYFGDTAFARSGGYNGNGHNGIDFRAPPGTKILAALAGEVIEVNHAAAPNCQYGKWVLVRHYNGLTTLYAHLSSITVTKGQTVATGQTVGYSGATGYATGPHLHLTVYASEAVEFKMYTCRSGPTVKVPVAAFSGYLNPLDYL